MEIDLARVRQETPGLDHVLHLESAGASLQPRVVLDAVAGYQEREALYGGYRVENESEVERNAVYTEIAHLINAEIGEIALSDSATRSWTSLVYSLPLKQGDIILTSVAEYASNLIAFAQLEKAKGIRFELIPNDETGQTSVAALEKLISPAVKLISITHTPTNGGLVNPAEEIGAVANKHDILFILDACQTVGQLPVDVKKIGCDFLTATGRKFLRGPRGTGFLYIKKERLEDLEPLMLDLFGAQWVSKDSYEMLPTAVRFEFWEKNYAAIVGLGAAVKYCNQLGIEAIWQRVQYLADTFRTMLADIDGIEVCDRGVIKCGIVTFQHASLAAVDIVTPLKAKMVNVSTTTAYGTPFDMEERKLTAIVRTSVHYYNSEAELNKFCVMLREVLSE